MLAMITILLISILSLLLYYFTFYKCKSVLTSPSLGQITFFRDYLLLTIIPYLYYLNNDNYKKHYIISAISSNNTIIIAAINAFIFMFFFLIVYRLFSNYFSVVNKKITITIFEKKLHFYLNIISVLLIIYFFFIAYKNRASIFGIFAYNVFELGNKRTTLSQTYTFLIQFDKLLITSWIPMFTYLLSFLFLKNKKVFYWIDKFILYIMIIVSFFASIYYFEKSMLFVNFLGFFSIYIYAGNKIKIKHIIIILVSAILSIFAMFILTYQDMILDNRYLIDIFIHRFMTQCAGSIMAIDYFSVNDKLGFAGVSHLWASAFGNTFQSVYAFLIDHYVPESKDISGSLSSFAVGDAFGLFGFFGVFISGIIVGVYYSFLEATKNSKFLSYIFVGFYGVYFSHSYIASGFYSFVWPVGMITQLLPFVVVVSLSSRVIRNV